MLIYRAGDGLAVTAICSPRLGPKDGPNLGHRPGYYGTIKQLDGKTGKQKFSYTMSSNDWQDKTVVHTDGTIFTVEGNSVTGLRNGKSFHVPLQVGYTHSSYAHSPIDPTCASYTDSTVTRNPQSSATIIAGDGFFYLLYQYTNKDSTDCEWGPEFGGPAGYTTSSHTQVHLQLLRIASDGSSRDIAVHNWSYDTQDNEAWDRFGSSTTSQASSTGETDVWLGAPFTNADQGVVVHWSEDNYPAYTSSTGPQTTWPVTGYKLASVPAGTLNGEHTLNFNLNSISLQHEDGTFIGTAYTSDYNPVLVRFDANGSSSWSKTETGEISPLYALADGSTVYQHVDNFQNIAEKVRADATGNELRRITDDGSRYGWLEGAYKPGSTELEVVTKPPLAPSYAAIFLGSASPNSTYIPQDPFPPLPPEKKNLLRNAQKALLSLFNKPACWTNAQVVIFNKFLDWNNVQLTPQTFINYLSRSPQFYAGPHSSLPFTDAYCGETHWYNWTRWGCGKAGTISSNWNQADTTAMTITPSDPFKSFWQPDFIRVPYDVPYGCTKGVDCDGVWPGVGIDPDDSGANLTNISALFHETLHGMTGKDDDDLRKALGLKTYQDTTNISLWILNNVVTPCMNTQ